MRTEIFADDKKFLEVDDENLTQLMQKELKYAEHPRVDLNSKTRRLTFHSLAAIQEIYNPRPFDFTKSLLFHIFLLCSYSVSIYFAKSLPMSPEIVEVNFGLTEASVQTQTKPLPDTQEGETEATRAKEDLPTLTKNVTPDEKVSPPAPLAKELILPKPAEKSEKMVLTEEHKKVEKIEKNTQKIKMDDYLKRKEMELRKEDLKNAAGIHNKDKMKTAGQKISLNKIPDSPFTSRSNVPETPFAAAPTGSVSGKVSASVYNDYKSYLARQLKLNWNASEGVSFPPHIKTKVQFKVNVYGNLVGDIRTVESSGNANFDKEVIDALKRTFPVSRHLPNELYPQQIFESIYSSSWDVK